MEFELAGPASPGLQYLPGWVKNASRVGALEDCSLVVATCNRPRELASLLHLLTALPDVPVQVVVVDGSPSKESEEALFRWAEKSTLPFDLLYVRCPAGLTRQRNAGIDAVGHELAR